MGESTGRVMLLARRELGGYLTSAFGWVIVAAVLMLDGVLFNGLALEGERTSSEAVYWFFYFAAGVTMTASVFIAMRTLAAEREQGTLVLLTTSPLSEWEIVLGKYLGALGFLVLITGATIYMPLMVMVRGDLPWGHVGAGYLGLLLLGATTTAVGLFASSVSRNQVLAVVLGGVLVVFLLVSWWLSNRLEPPLKSFFGYLALFNKHFMSFLDGGVHLRALVFYPTFAFLFLLASVRVLQARRWR